MMMVDHIVALVRSQNHRDHVPAEKLALLSVWLVLPPALSQALALFLHLPHSNRHLRWMQREDRNRLKDRFTRIRHDLESLSDGQKIAPKFIRLWHDDPRDQTAFAGS